MNWIVENWFILVTFAAIFGVVVLTVYRLHGLPAKKQVEKVKEWLVWACVEAEKALQSGVGQLKLRQVYDMFCAVPAFTWVAKLVTFELFSEWVSDALIVMKKMLISNPALAKYVYGNNADEEIEKIRSQLGSTK